MSTQSNVYSRNTRLLVTSFLITHLRTALIVVGTPRARTVAAESHSDERAHFRIALEMGPHRAGHGWRVLLALTGMEPRLLVGLLVEKQRGFVRWPRSVQAEQNEQDERCWHRANHAFRPIDGVSADWSATFVDLNQRREKVNLGERERKNS